MFQQKIIKFKILRFPAVMAYETLAEKKAQEIYKLIGNLRKSKNVRIGFNETIKSINNNASLIAIVASDAEPNCLVTPLSVLCEQKGAEYVFVSSKTALGKACGLEIDVLSCSLVARKNEDFTKLQNQISKILK